MSRAMEDVFVAFGNLAWGFPLLVLLLAGGFAFLLISGARPQLHLWHALLILFGRFDKESGQGSNNEPNGAGQRNTADGNAIPSAGRISHFQALATALSSTIGLGNIAGVAVALATGGPGALFWMWVSAILGTSTKFFTCTLAVRYRGRPGVPGDTTGGPMYTIVNGLGPRFRPLALAFAWCGVLGCLPLVAANQLVRVLHDLAVAPSGLAQGLDESQRYLILGVLIAGVCALVVFGGLSRLAAVAAKLVPAMTVGYLAMAGWVLLQNAPRVPGVFALIFEDAFTGQAAAGGSLGTVLLIGMRRGVFSNEAGIGTEAMAHGEARTDQPVREGLVAMLGPLIDTLLVCTSTALVILLSGVSTTTEAVGVRLSLAAFKSALPTLSIFGTSLSLGELGLGLACAVFGLSTLFGYSYYGGKCLEFVAGRRLSKPYALYNWIYVLAIVACAPATLRGMMGFLDGCFALMAWPTMISALLLAPRVREMARNYFDSLRG